MMKLPYRYIIAAFAALFAVWAGYSVCFRPIRRQERVAVYSAEGEVLEVEYELTVYRNRTELSGPFPGFAIQTASKAEGKICVEGTEYLCDKKYITASGGCFFRLPGDGSREGGIWAYLDEEFQISRLSMGERIYSRRQGK